MQHNLGLVQLLLDLHDAVRLLRVLVFHEVFFERRKGQRWRVGGGEGGAWVFGQELVDDFGEQLVRDERGVVLVADDDAGDAFGAAVGVEGVCCETREGVWLLVLCGVGGGNVAGLGGVGGGADIFLRCLVVGRVSCALQRSC